MCDILFSQLCLRVPPATAPSFGDDVQHDRNLNLTSVNKKSDIDNHVLKQDSFHWVDIALGVAFGSKGRGNLPGATSDIRAILILLLFGKCSADHVAFQEEGQEQCLGNPKFLYSL
jgi:hypothetical protein